ncbi:MAG TPA: DNA methyltransferase [Anaerolineae bacterium]
MDGQMRPAGEAPFTIPLDTDFDITFANDIARLEAYNKHHYRPNSYLHKWWARRCGSTFRLILKQLVADEAHRSYYEPGGLAGKVILDPMMGGGTTLHEAIRMGANVIGVDLDPIPVLQARATLSDASLLALEQAFKQIYGVLQAELEADYFITTCPTCATATPLRYVLYGLRRYCACGPALVLDSVVLRQEADGSVIRICPDCHVIASLSAERAEMACECPAAGKTPIVERGVRSCPTCGEAYLDALEAPFYRRYEPLVAVGRCRQHGLFFKAPDSIDLLAIERANERRPSLAFDVEDFVVKPGRKSIQLVRRGIDNYLDLFSSRQLLYLERAIAHLANVEPLLRLNLALLVSTSLEFNAMLCGYKGKSRRRAGAIRHTFSHHAYSFPYTALENNPLHPRRASGTLRQLFHTRIRRGRQWAQRPRERVLGQRKRAFIEVPGEVDSGVEVFEQADLTAGSRRFLLQQGSSAHLNLETGSVDCIVTDPPYFDSVQYSDLAAFFRVWLRHLLPEVADWDYDVNQSAVDPHKRSEESRYAEILGGIFAECHRVLRKDSGRFVFTFHHWNPRGWAALTLALKKAGFMLVNRYVVYSENPTSVHIANMKALTHDAILVLAPIEASIRREWQRPARVGRTDSERFCGDCATLLGWLLGTDLAAVEIEQVWQEALVSC